MVVVSAKRTFIFFILFPGIFLALCMLLHPWAVAWLLGYVLRSQQVGYADFQVQGFSHYRLHGIEWSAPDGTHVKVDNLTVRQPIPWLLALRKESTEPWVTISGVAVLVAADEDRVDEDKQVTGALIYLTWCASGSNLPSGCRERF
ncbi:MAG: hypothetical protein LR015_05445 [Verrucomicrobia bacterium]|nr:hypothetical protein [Verrucomicrobiota bacterium]